VAFIEQRFGDKARSPIDNGVLTEFGPALREPRRARRDRSDATRSDDRGLTPPTRPIVGPPDKVNE
jgi:hypothetical protein